MQCEFVKDDGERCGAMAMTESRFCFSHNPDSVEDKLAAVRKGGAASRGNSTPLSPMPIQSVDDIKSVIEDTVNRIRTEPFTHQKANSIGYLLNIAVNAIEVKEIEKRLQAIEDRV